MTEFLPSRIKLALCGLGSKTAELSIVKDCPQLQVGWYYRDAAIAGEILSVTYNTQEAMFEYRLAPQRNVSDDWFYQQILIAQGAGWEVDWRHGWEHFPADLPALAPKSSCPACGADRRDKMSLVYGNRSFCDITCFDAWRKTVDEVLNQ